MILLPEKLITRKQEREFAEDLFRRMRISAEYYDAIFILFNTGLRISEFCGLTKSDLDFKNKSNTGKSSITENKSDAVCH